VKSTVPATGNADATLGNPKTRMRSREVSSQHVELRGNVALTTGQIDTKADSSIRNGVSTPYAICAPTAVRMVDGGDCRPITPFGRSSKQRTSGFRPRTEELNAS